MKLEGIIRDVEETISYSQNYPFDINCKPLIEKWAKNKAHLYHLLGDQLIWRSPEKINITLTEAQKDKRFTDLVNTLSDVTMEKDENFKEFLLSNKEGFFDNVVVSPWPDKNIQKGQKLSKSLRKFINDEYTIRWAQDAASRVMQESKISGYLYISIDPRDFLTLSENNQNWSSCHGLDRQFRAGNLSYMVDKVTMVAYVASDKQEELKCGLYWNSKKWRTLLHLTDTCLYFNRQYPYQDDSLIDMIMKIFQKDFKSNLSCLIGIGYTTIKTAFGLEPLRETMLNAGGYYSYRSSEIIDTEDYNGYCDLTTNPNFDPVCVCDHEAFINYLLNESKEKFKKVFGIKIGEQVPCVVCGRRPVNRTNSFLCDDCILDLDADEDFFTFCMDCGSRIWDGEKQYQYDENIILCRHCYNKRLKGED